MDNRYKTFKYGTTHKYGASTGVVDALAWGVEVDWDGDGVFDGTNEADRVTYVRMFRGRDKMLRPSGEGFEPIRVGSMNLILDNYDGKYDGWNTASSLYPNVGPGKDIKVRVRDMNTGTVYDVFRGNINDLYPSGYDQEPQVTITAEDGGRILRESRVFLARQDVKRNDEIITAILDQVQWPTRYGRMIPVSSDYIRYWWAGKDTSAFSEIEDVTLPFLGFFFIANDGKATYIPKFGSLTSVVSFAESEMKKDVGNPQPWLNKRDTLKVKISNIKILGSLVDGSADPLVTPVVWQEFDNLPTIISGGTSDASFIDLDYQGFDAGIILTFVAANATNSAPVYYTNESGAIVTAGTGELSGAMTQVYTSNKHFATSALIQVSNPFAWTAYVYEFYVLGQVAYIADTKTISYPRDPSAEANRRELYINIKWFQGVNEASQFVDGYGPFVTALQKYPVIQVENRTTKQFTPDLFDVISIDLSSIGIGPTDMRVGGIEMQSLDSMQAIRHTFYLETPITAEGNYFIFDTDAFSGGEVFGW